MDSLFNEPSSTNSIELAPKALPKKVSYRRLLINSAPPPRDGGKPLHNIHIFFDFICICLIFVLHKKKIKFEGGVDQKPSSSAMPIMAGILVVVIICTCLYCLYCWRWRRRNCNNFAPSFLFSVFYFVAKYYLH